MKTIKTLLEDLEMDYHRKEAPHHIVDTHNNNAKVGEAKGASRARNKAEKMNQEYGAVRYSVKRVD